MSFTLDELNSLISALGVTIPDQILTQKADAEKFEARNKTVVTDAAAKPADWRLKSDFDAVLQRASESAGQKQFETAFQLLDQAEKLLQQPDHLPAAEIPAAPPLPGPESPEEPAVVQAQASAEPTATDAAASTSSSAEPVEPPGTLAGAEDAKAESVVPGDGLVTIWRNAKERVDKQVSLLQGALRQTKEPACLRIAEMGLNGVTGKLQVGLQVALTECDRTNRRDPKLNAGAASIIAQYQQFLQSDPTIALCDDNPFGVECEIRSTLLEALAELERSFKS